MERKMTIKMTNLKDEKGNPIKLNQPAFLVGNGINLADGCNELKWNKLLSKVIFGTSDIDIEQEFKGLNYPEIAELAELYQKNKTKKENIKIDPDKTIKKQICEEIIKREEAKNKNEISKLFVTFCRDNNIPVLTTNFDHRLLLSLDITKEKSKNFEKKMIETPFWFLTKEEKLNNHLIPYRYPFRAYFAEDEIKPENIRNEFAVWHVHGTKRYIDSISINYIDYARNIAEIDKMIRDKKQIGTIWDERYSWIDIFMRNDLVIIGLGLDSSETDIRWLLRERHVYQELMNKDKLASTIYIYSKEEGIAAGKSKLFEALGIRCVPMAQDEIYVIEKYLK